MMTHFSVNIQKTLKRKLKSFFILVQNKTQNILLTNMTTCTIGTQTDEIVMCTTSTQTDEELIQDIVKVARRWRDMRDVWQEEFLFLPKVPLPIQKQRKIY